MLVTVWPLGLMCNLVMDKDDFFSGVLKIALGIALGVFMLWLLAVAVLRYQMNQAAKVVEVAAAAAVENLREVQARAEARQRTADAEKNQRLEIVRQQQLALARQAAERVQAEQQKEVAWQRFYQPSSKCLNPSSFDVSVECGNIHIRAKREFEVRWLAGSL